MSVVYSEEQVNTYTPGDQLFAQIAVLADGSYVITWQSYGQDGANEGVYFQRYSASGVPIGAEIRANTAVGAYQEFPHVAALSDGGFVLVWQDNSAIDGSTWSVISQRFDGSGTPVGANEVVNTTTASGQYHCSVTSYEGGYAVAWASEPGGLDIYIKTFSNAGVPMSSETLVSAEVGSPAVAQSGTQYFPDIDADSAGNLVVVWHDQGGNDGSGYGVFGRLVSSTGVLSDTFVVNTTTGGSQSYPNYDHGPQVAMLASGGFVVVWSSDSNDGSGWSVMGQRFDASGVKLGGEFLVNETTTGSQYQPAVTGLSTGGFVVSWYNDNYDVSGTGTTSDVYIREYDAAGVAIDGQRKLLSGTNSTEYRPAIADLGSGNFVVAYADYDGGYDIAQQLFGTASELPRQAAPELGDFTGTVTFGENQVNAAPQVIDPAVSLSDADSANFAGGQIDLFYVQGGEATDQLGVRNQGNGFGQIGVAGVTVSYGGTAIGTITGNGASGANLVISLNSAATVEAVESLIQNLTYASSSQSPDATRTMGLRVSDGDGGSSAASTVTINVTGELDGAPVVYGEERVNTYSTSTQDAPQVAVLADGSYVIVWDSEGQDGASTGVYGQRFSASGVPMGAEFRINSVTTGTQDNAKVAATSDGGFVVMWEDSSGVDGSGQGLVAQRFNGAGVAQGGNFVVNGTTTSTQYQASMAGYTGGFAAVWVSTHSGGGADGYDVYLRRFDNAGNQVTAETRVSTTPGNPADAQNGTQQEAKVAAYANGNLVIVWTDQGGNDGNLYGVYGRTYNAATGTFGDSFLVNTTTASYQYEPAVATLSDGGFVVVWRSNDQDGSSAGVYAQRYNAAGAAVGGEFLVNESTNGGQYQPAVTGLSTGGFVVSWYNDNYDVGDTSTSSDVYIREYDAAGVAIDGQRKLLSDSNSTEYQPAIADLGSGNFVVAYADYDGGYDIAQQIFGTASELVRPSQAPEIGDLTDLRILVSNSASALYAGNPQLIDGDVSVSDADSANFDGGSLVVTLLNGATASETLGVRHQGSGAGQIGVSGSNVSFGGVVIGTVTGGTAGASVLTISFNANASPAAARALIENITYQNTVPPGGTTDRYVSFRLSDGDGGVSEPWDVAVRIQAAFTPATVVLADLAPTVVLSESAAQAGAVLDDAVQLDYNGATGFSNGTLTVSYASSTARVDDQLAIRNEGSGAGQVGVSGSNVSYEGSVIGTVNAADNGVNGDNLVITFNASATATAIERVIENLSYRTTSEAPNESRTVTVVVRDGANVASTSYNMVIEVTPETDPAAPVTLLGEQQTNSYEAGDQTTPAVARLLGANAGGYVITWVSQGGQDGDGYGVFAQRYSATGAAMGPEFQVNTQTVATQAQPTVTGLASGGFVVVWYDSQQDGSGYGVYAQRYGADGAAQGSEFRVNSSTLSNQYEPTVLGLADGSFVVAYRSDYSTAAGTYTYDVLGQRFAADGTPLGAEFTLNTLVTGTQYQPQLSALSGGGFVAIWTDTSGDASGYGIVAQRFASDGSKVGGEIPVNTTVTGTQQGPDVAGLVGGGFVAVWEYNNTVFVQRFDAAGTKLGGELVGNTSDTLANLGNDARVSALDGGGFVVTWTSSSTPGVTGGSGYDVFAQKFDASGNKIDGPVLVNTETYSTQQQPDVAALTGSNFVVTWSSYGSAGNNPEQNGQGGSSYSVQHQLFGTPGSITAGLAPVITDLSVAVTLDEALVNAAPQLIDGSVNLVDADSANFAGGHLWVSVISGYGDILQAQLPETLTGQDQLGIRHQGSGAGQVGVSGSTVSFGGVVVGSILATGASGGDLVVQFNANATPTAVEAIIENLTYANTSSAPVGSRTLSVSVSDGDGSTSVPRLVQINVTPDADGAQALFDNEIVNTYRPNTQDNPASSALADGGYVTVWQSQGQDGWGNGIHGQRFDANGVPVGSEFQVNTYTPGEQTLPQVAGLSGGGFVVMWQSNGQDGSGYGIYGQRYDANAVPVGEEFLVNTNSTYDQLDVSVSALNGGGFVATWHSYFQDGSYYNIYAQRFDAAGNKLGAEFVVTSETVQGQHEPSVSTLADGNFVVVWRSDGQDGNSGGVYAQRFSSVGAELGPEFLVNTQTDNNQWQPQVTALTGGGFVVVWTSTGQDLGGSYGVFAQRFDANGNALGNEFRVNTNTAGNEYEPTVSALSNGGFVVAWNDDGRISAQQFDASGARVDGELLVDTHDNSGAGSAPAVVGLAGGAFVVSWTDYDYSSGGGDNTYQIFQQLYGNPALVTRGANPELVDVVASVTFAENTINAVPQLIDPGVGLFDADSANFDGGLLEVDYLTDYGAQDQLGLQGLDNQDQLGIRHEGSGAGQVGVSGSAISFGGVVIGSIVSNGANGAKLAVQFNANASVEAVEQVIENLTYANSVSNPIASRTISIRVTDGDGGASEARSVQINVTPEVDGAVPIGLEKVVNTTRGGAQHEPSVARLADGGYVVVWEDQSGNDGSSYGVYGQRYDTNDNPVGGEFRVNTTTTGAQYEAQVTGLTGGGYVVVWRSDGQDGSGAGVYAQRYGADGVAVGGEFQVNTLTLSNQYQVQIDATSSGGFVVTWYHDYYNSDFSQYWNIYFQRFDATGTAVGVETQANPIDGNTHQHQPDVAWSADGSGFVVVWADSFDGLGYDIFAQQFDSSGMPAGTVIHVNSWTSTQLSMPSVAALKGGGFVVVWESEGQDLSSTGVYAQRYAADGTAVGAEFRVNTNISSTQYDPHVTALENGGWVVTWSDSGNTADNSGWGVFAQQYNAAGQPVDGELRINSYQYSTQYQPSIASMGDGGFVVAYSGHIASWDANGDGVGDGGNDTQEIRLQRFSNTAPDISDVVANVNEEATVVLTYALFDSGFNDADGQVLQAIKIVTLPGEGTLRLNGVAVLPDQEISAADLEAGLLTYQGDVDFFGLDQFRWTGSDGIAFASTPVYTNINVQNVNDGPRLEAGADDTAAEGNFFSHTITLGDPDPEGHQITVDWGDGTGAQVYNVGNTPTHNISHYYYENGNYAVTVTANDQRGLGNSIEVDGFNVAVSNVAPTIFLSGSNSVEQGQTYTLDLSAPYDPANNAGNTNDTVSEYRIDWGDGTPVEVFSAATLPANGIVTHVFGSSGPKTISVDLVDEDGIHTDAGVKSIDVSAPAEVLTVSAGADIAVSEGSFFQKSISFDDPTDTGGNGRQATVTWGDGQTSVYNIGAGQNSFLIGHTYADGANNFSVSVTVDDDGAQQGSDSFNVAVNNVAPTVSVGGAGSVSEGSVYTISLNPNDPGADTASAFTVHWGDGTADTALTAAELLALGGNVTHAYADGSVTRAITVDMVDEDGTWLAAGTHNVFVSNVAPTASVSGANSVAEGSVYVLSVGAVSDPGADTRTGYSINWGDGTVQSFTPTEWAAASGTFSHTYADGGNGGTGRSIVVSATDEDGSFTLGSKAITVTNVVPELSLAGAADVNEGSSYSLSITGSDAAGANDPLSYSIDWGDGSTVQTLTAAELALLGGSVGHVFADDQDGPVNSTARSISVTASDGDGASTTVTRGVNVHNVAPTLSAAGAANATTGLAYTLSLSALIDPGQDTLLANGISIDWGDGTTSTHSSLGDITHTYTAVGTPTITVSLADEDGSYANVSSVNVTVGAPANTVALEAGVDASLSEGQTFSRTIAFSDGEDNGAAGWTYSVDWDNDGVADETGSTASNSFSLSRLLADGDANQIVVVSVTDEAGETATDSFMLSTTNVAPTAPVTGADSVAEGSAYLLSVGAVVDPGADTRTGYSIHWGDGTVQSFTPAEWGAAAGSFSHTYADGGNGGTGRSIVVTATDEDGTFTLGSKAITVTNVVPELSLAGAADVNEGSSYSLVINGNDAAGANDPLSYSIDWGDGSVVQTLTAAELALLGGSVSHVFTDDQDGPVNSTARSISVTASDGDGGSTTVTRGVNVHNVAPTIALAGAAAVVEDTSYTLTLGAVTDPGSDTVSSYVVDWGDGNTTTHGAAGDVTHTYANPGNYSISVSLVDEDGTHAAAGSRSVEVTAFVPGNAAPVADDDSYSVKAGSTLTIAAPGVLDGDTDADGDSLSVVVIADNVDHGSLSLFPDGHFVYTPDTGFTGVDSFVYRVSDGVGGFDEATVTIDVFNAAPVADDDSYSVKAGSTLTIAAPGVLDGDTDADGDSLSVVVIADNVDHGSLSLFPDGHFVYTPDTGFTGVDSFVYRVSDGVGGFDEATVTIDVFNTAPVADDEAYSVQAGEVLTIAAPGILDGDTDADGDALSVLSVDATGLQGTLIQQANGAFQFTPTAGFTGNTSFEYTVSDGFGGLDTAIVHIEVQAAPEPTVIHLGDATGVISTANPYAWAPFWTHEDVTITHKADASSSTESWSAVNLTSLGATALAGGDLYAGDLGVSGRQLLTSTVSQELSGAEALRFDLDNAATKVTVDLTRFYVDDDANTFNYNEAGRIQALDAHGNVVAETTFVAGSSLGLQTVSLTHAGGFNAVVFTAGAYDAGGQFVFGAYANDAGALATAPYNDGKLHGSDFLLDSIEFEIPPVLGINPDPGT